MTLRAYTARISSRDPDRFDVTRKSGGPQGEPFAPSWAILRPALDARRRAERLMDDAHALTHSLDGNPYALANEADRIEAEAWAAYEPAFLDQMRRSYRAHRPAWDALLARPRVVLVCYCVDHTRCHRTILARDILPTLGAVYEGEVRT